MFPDPVKNASSSSSRPLNAKEKEAQEILKHLFSSSAAKEGQYVRNSMIVTRCEGWASITVNGEEVATTKHFTSGADNPWPGANWTGIMADIGNKRYGAAKYQQAGKEDEEGMSRLRTCVEGKCLFDLMSRGAKKYFTKDNNVVIKITITFDAPCGYCDAALYDWVNQYIAACRSLKLVVQGKRDSFSYGSGT